MMLPAVGDMRLKEYSHELVGPEVVRIGYLSALLFGNRLRRRVSSSQLTRASQGCNSQGSHSISFQYQCASS